MITLFEHQRRCVDLLAQNPRFGLWLEPGMGKTITTLAAIEADPIRTVVVCPKSIMASAWLKDAQHFPSLNVRILAHANPAKRLEAIQNDHWRVGVLNFDQFKTLRRELLEAGVERLVVDESSKLKNPDSAITKAAIHFADRMASVWLLSGTPAPNSPVEYYSQIRAMRKDVCGDLYYRWIYQIATPIREKVWRKPVNRPARQIDVIVGYKQSETQRAELERQLGMCSIAMRKQDALDLPKQTNIVRTFTLDEAEADAYREVADNLRIMFRNEVERVSGEAALMKLRQVTGGHVITGDVPRQIGRSKLNALNDTLDEIGPRPCLIWAEFRHEIDAIAELCRRRDESVSIIDGRTSSLAGGLAAQFQDGQIQRLICQPQAAGHGITLTRASYAVYYSLGFSYENFKQSRDRIHRLGQTEPCTYYILIAEDTVDEATYGVVRGKGKASDALLAVLSGNMKSLAE